jgi:fibronectin type 3 domain-containing protein
MLNFTTKGYIEVYRDGVLISQHTQETKAVESAAQHADAHGDGEYRFKYPEKVLRVIGTLAPSTDTQAPTQPTNLSATAVNRQRIDLTWTASTDNVGVVGYQIFRNGSPLDVATTNSYTDSTVTASTTYTYSVVAFDAAGNNSTASSSAQATTPANATPTWSAISAQTLIVGDSYTLDVAPSCSDADADTLVFSNPSGLISSISGLAFSGSIISGVPTTAGQSLTATIRASDGFASADTTIAFATYNADVTAPPVPTGLAASASGSTSIGITWSPSTDVAGSANEYVSGTQDYRLYRSTDNSSFSLRATISGTTSYSDTGLSSSTTYYYKITARDVELNESAQSSSVNATTTSSTNPDTDFQAIATAGGNLYAFDGTSVYYDGVLQSARTVSSTTGLLAEAYQTPGDTTAVTRDTTIKLSGSGSIRIALFPTSGTQSGSWAFRPNGRDGTVYREVWTRFSVYYPKETLGYRYQLGGSIGQLKVLNFGQFGGGQLVVSNWRFMGFPSAFVDGSNMISDSSESNHLIGTPNPWSTTVHRIQDAIDTGASVSTKTDYLTRYGPLGRGLDGDMDTSYSASNPYLYNRTQPSGFPDTRAATNGVAFALDGWTDIEVYLYYNEANPSQSTMMMWAAPRGSAPKLIMSNINVLQLGTNTTNSWDRFEILNYDTDRQSEASRPTLYTYYTGLCTSRNMPINFPGGRYLPNRSGQSALLTACEALSSGDNVILSTTWTGGDIPTDQDINWNNKFHYDHIRGIAYMATKLQNVSTAMTHAFFDESTSTWLSENCGFDRNGHVYDSSAYDYTTGTGYLVPGGGRDNFLYRTTWSPGSALSTPSPTSKDANTEISSIMYASSGDFISSEGAMDYHPNLFGEGLGGMVIVCKRGIAAWRKSTDTYSVILSSSGIWDNADIPSCVYSRGLDACIVCINGPETGTAKAYRVSRNNSITVINTPPMAFGPDSLSVDSAALVDDPLGRATVYALDRTSAKRVWKYSSGSWVLQGFTHPFTGLGDTTDFLVAAAYGRGVIMGLERVNTGNLRPRLRLWKPPS